MATKRKTSKTSGAARARASRPKAKQRAVSEPPVEVAPHDVAEMMKLVDHPPEPAARPWARTAGRARGT